ncbi:MAG: helix-turn-helix domain-containing protein [Ruminococcus sp.]|jgi:transcription regulator|nr:helix-turn-helix domain-containing protein [Ruminococcus sp.]
MEFEEKFAERLSQLRLAKGVSARDMSLSIGQSAGYINNIENKNNLPSMSAFFYICEYLEISPQDFFDFDNKNPEKINEIVGYLKQVDDEQLNNLISIVKGLIK